jgi:hypothetical protein
MVRANTNNTLDFAHQVLRVESPAAFVEVSAEHARKQFETIGDQARHLTGLAQKLTSIGCSSFNASHRLSLDVVPRAWACHRAAGASRSQGDLRSDTAKSPRSKSIPTLLSGWKCYAALRFGS